MERRSENDSSASIWIERLVWNAAAMTALGSMIVVLLCALQWLDGIEREARLETEAFDGRVRAEVEASTENRPTVVARVNAPSG
jgi:hypothetical protein